jgi:4-amino-4-deoxy-L-arabinose transferase-like glycosyltransferase
MPRMPSSWELPRRHAARPTTFLAIAAASVATVLAGLFAALTPPGQPYDEPAHWSNVQFYAEQHRMPTLGEPGATYEAQMGPLYYALAAVLVEAAGWLGATDGTALFIVRTVGVLLVPALAWVTYRLARAVHQDASVAALAVALVSLSPLVLVTAGTVQNDVLAIVLSALATLVGARALADPSSAAWRHTLVGCLIGLAVLTKVVAVSLVPALLLAYVLVPASRAHRLRNPMLALAGVAVTCGWWFLRNLATYGDLTGASGMADAGYSWPRFQPWVPDQLASWTASLVSYVYAPVEYYRNALDTPQVLRVAAAALAALTLVALVGYTLARARTTGLRRGFRDRPDRVLLVATVVAAVGFYLAYTVFVWWIAARLAFVSVAAASVVVAIGTRGRGGALVRGGTLAVYVVSSVWMVVEVSGLPPRPFWIVLG